MNWTETPDGKYRVQVIADSSGEYVGNGLRFPTIEDALKYGHNLAMRWTLVRSFRVIDDAGATIRVS